MDRPSSALPKLFAWVAGFSATTFSGSELQAQVLIGAARGPGGYLSPLKIGLIAIVFLIWVKLSDWINRDTIRIGDLTGHRSKIWNPINLGSFLVGFLAAISIPIFWAGFPIYVLAAFAPFTVYLFLRSSAVKSDRSIAERLNPDAADELLEQDLGTTIEFSPAGDTNADQQSNLIRARQSPGFPVSKDLLSEVILKRAEVLLIDYSQTQATPRILVDGTWHPMAPMDRETGDGVLFSLKHLAGLNPGERRALQSGKFALKSPEHGKRKIQISSQGIPNGERVQIKIIGANADPLPLKKLGLLPSMEAPFSAALNSPGICIVSAPPKEGLTATWQGLLLSADRLTRDCIGLVTAADEKETAVENIVIKHYEPGTQETIAVQALLTQPNSMAVPKIETKGVMDVLVKATQSQELSVWLQTPAKSAVEALLRTSLKAKNRNPFAESVKHVTNQRLARRLCDACKQEVRVQPKLIQQLGGDPRKQGSIFQAYRLPPPEQRIDENGKPIEFPPCKTCGGLGHVGRIALFEMLTVNQAVRDALLSSNPDLKTIDAVATKTKAKIPLSASAWKLVLLGVISLQEAQATLKK